MLSKEECQKYQKLVGPAPIMNGCVGSSEELAKASSVLDSNEEVRVHNIALHYFMPFLGGAINGLEQENNFVLLTCFDRSSGQCSMRFRKPFKIMRSSDPGSECKAFHSS